jgi:hypothetical protein
MSRFTPFLFVGALVPVAAEEPLRAFLADVFGVI